VDPTGAGDAFAAAYLIALDEGADPWQAARFAAAAASFVVEAVGSVTPERAAVERRLREGGDA
jgi:sugar/nucleoside kinase (ribokinase family)